MTTLTPLVALCPHIPHLGFNLPKHAPCTMHSTPQPSFTHTSHFTPFIASGGESLALGEEIGRRIAQHGGAALIIDYGDDHVHSSSLQVSTLTHSYTYACKHNARWRTFSFS